MKIVIILLITNIVVALISVFLLVNANLTSQKRKSAKNLPIIELNPKVRVGDWGHLEMIPLIISPPLEFAFDEIGSDEVGFTLNQVTPIEWQNFVMKLPMNTEAKEELLRSSRFDFNQQMLIIEPNQNLLENLPQKARSILYNYLASNPSNFMLQNAYRFPTSLEQKILNDPLLSPAAITFLNKFLYRSGSFTHFADQYALLNNFPKNRERSYLLQQLASQETFLGKIKITPEMEIDKIIEYWGKGGRAKDIGPLLKSLQDSGQEQTIDIVHLLPGFARRRIYTYPKYDEADLINRRDCHWTAFNFFSDHPDERFSDSEFVIETLRKEFSPIYGNVSFGDLVAFSDANGDIYHSAIMIADDILYTKNGAGPHSPWILMTMENMKEFYPRPGKIKINYFRKNGL